MSKESNCINRISHKISITFANRIRSGVGSCTVVHGIIDYLWGPSFGLTVNSGDSSDKKRNG